ncbi:secretoglobin family 2B member 20-like [Apodemus sylvaticus]|uniref:secretoglobin family 2B member 20-like n=1 Tax=Apodemus sylvaticus TaxID=10129 RepID=UPI0022423262|nr:secretoglobin family 2B member 20-like [Apodemus sylvaticus]
MKGTLLLLALLVTGELGFQTTEACTPFFRVYFSILFASKNMMKSRLSLFDASTEELEAFEKLQGCYEAGGVYKIHLNPQILESMLLSPECLKYHGSDMV